ncbi:Cytochrome P450 E-class group I [Penicillium brevicompactum]|uniref:Cytochrome P450 E-class group I n=1 Tax=Penicillium brevicompactum TaxID=5074 RepID=A0A9W9RVL0_PENBR|nr:Cytochrome P450 E-class group I [Penicillium brevicompactum]
MDYIISHWGLASLIAVIVWVVFASRYQLVTIIISNVVHPIRNFQGQAIQGPKWQSLDGQCLDKFLNGREVSQAWRKHGPVYRIWSGFTPEVYVDNLSIVEKRAPD